MESPNPSDLEAWFATHKEKIEALIDEGCAAVERGEPIDSDNAHSRLNEMRRAQFPRYFKPLR
jgi:hypothetical protein